MDINLAAVASGGGSGDAPPPPNNPNGKGKAVAMPDQDQDPGSGDDSETEKPSKRSGRRKIKIEYIEDKNRRHITFSKRKAGIMKKVKGPHCNDFRETRHLTFSV